jgi:hypothetical protein
LMENDGLMAFFGPFEGDAQRRQARAEQGGAARGGGQGKSPDRSAVFDAPALQQRQIDGVVEVSAETFFAARPFAKPSPQNGQRHVAFDRFAGLVGLAGRGQLAEPAGLDLQRARALTGRRLVLVAKRLKSGEGFVFHKISQKKDELSAPSVGVGQNETKRNGDLSVSITVAEKAAA